jgi:hypothetical protein
MMINKKWDTPVFRSYRLIVKEDTGQRFKKIKELSSRLQLLT